MPFRLTTVATFRTPTAAWIARNYLASQGIRAHVFDDHIATAIWTWGNAIGWTKLQVETESEQAAHQALQRWREARDLLLSECSSDPVMAPQGRPLPPPCMDRQPVTAAEHWQPTPNLRESLVHRAMLATVYAFVLLGNAVGLPGRWEQMSGLNSGIFVEMAGLGLLGYSSWLLWQASTSPETLRPVYQRDLFWGKCINISVYLLLAFSMIYIVTRVR